MKIVRVLRTSGSRRSVRELIDLSSLSPAGVRDVLRRLEDHGVVRKDRSGNKVLYTLTLNTEEESLVDSMIAMQSKGELEQGARLLSQKREHAIGWIDETVAMWQQQKRTRK